MKNTDKLKSDLSKLEADSSELEEKVKMKPKVPSPYQTSLARMIAGNHNPIKNYWGSDNQELPLDGPFDAVTLYADRLYIRKGELYWDQPVVGIKALNYRRSD